MLKCNIHHLNIPIVRRHKFIRIDLHLHILDPAVYFSMMINQTNIPQKVQYTEVLEGVKAFQITTFNYAFPNVYYSRDSYLTLTVTRFMYSSPKKNVMADHVYNLPHFASSGHAAFLPKGKCYFQFFSLDSKTYNARWHSCYY